MCARSLIHSLSHLEIGGKISQFSRKQKEQTHRPIKSKKNGGRERVKKAVYAWLLLCSSAMMTSKTSHLVHVRLRKWAEKNAESIFNTSYTHNICWIKFVYMELSNAATFFLSRCPLCVLCGSNVYKAYGTHMAHILRQQKKQSWGICELKKHTQFDTPQKRGAHFPQCFQPVSNSLSPAHFTQFKLNKFNYDLH